MDETRKLGEPVTDEAAAEQLKKEWTERHRAADAGAEAAAEQAQPFEISDGQAEEIAGPQINLPMLTIPLNGANLQIVKDDESGERAIIVGPLAVQFILPFTEASAKAVGADLAGYGGIEIVSAIPAASAGFRGGKGLVKV